MINTNPPVGDGLEREIKKLAQLSDDDPSALQDLSNYAVKQDKDLFSLLCNMYTIRTLSPEQKVILSQPWLRIYTTNYDDVVEAFWKSTSSSSTHRSYSTESQVPTQFRSGSVVHLHGYIHECTRENLLRQLVLSHYSYAQQRAILSPWWDVFDRDMRVAKNVFFVGYDLKDFEPAKYLTKNPLAVEKTHFILRPTQSPVAASRLDEYGRRDPMGVSGFAEECKACVVAEKPKHANALRAFRFVDLLKDDKVAARTTPLEIQSLFAFGKFIFARLLTTFPEPTYSIPRDQALAQCLTALLERRTLILHSKIGNGKTIFRQGLTIALTERGHNCFELREKVTPIPAEIEFIAGQSKPVIVFPDYDSAYSNIHLFNELKPDARFIVEIATGTLQVRHSEVFDRLPKPLERVDLNRLSSDDCKAIYKLLDEAGIAPRDFNLKFGKGAEMRDIVLSVFENANVIKRIDDVVQPILANSDAKVVLFCSAILKALGLRTDPGFLRSFSGVDSYQVLCETGEGAYEFVDFAHDR
ncbi:MAG TPA: SIR2 family protein, partial [Methylobacter sp.]